MRHFERYHPLVLFTYFAGVLAISMLTLDPIIVGICFFSSFAFCGTLIGGKKLLQGLPYSLFIVLLFGATNPLFVVEGDTVLFLLFQRPYTLEAVCYGLTVGFMFLSVFYWFKCYTEVVSTDKFIYLFGRIIPKLSLVLSMTLNFIPRFKRQYKKIQAAQKAMGAYSSKSYFSRIKSRLGSLSVLITWALENSVETADSMRARGYGLKKRSSFLLYRFRMRDALLLFAIFVLAGAAIAAVMIGGTTFSFYPAFSAFEFSAVSIAGYAAIFLLSFLAIILETKEGIKWAFLKSKI